MYANIKVTQSDQEDFTLNGIVVHRDITNIHYVILMPSPHQSPAGIFDAEW